MSIFYKVKEFAHAHPYEIGAIAVGGLLFIVIVRGGSSKAAATTTGTPVSPLQLAQLQASTETAIARIQADASAAPAMYAAQAAEAQSSSSTTVGVASALDSLKASLAATSASLGITQSNNDASVAIDARDATSRDYAASQSTILGQSTLSEKLSEALAATAASVTNTTTQVGGAVAINQQNQDQLMHGQDITAQIDDYANQLSSGVFNEALTTENGLFSPFTSSFAALMQSLGFASVPTAV